METVYTVREFRKRMKEALDRCVHDNVYIERNGIRFSVHRDFFPGAKNEVDTAGLTKKLVFGEYGCGCRVTDGEVLCRKHGRR